MSLKPGKHAAVLVQERIEEALHSGKLSPPEKEELREFDDDLERYLQ